MSWVAALPFVGTVVDNIFSSRRADNANRLSQEQFDELQAQSNDQFDRGLQFNRRTRDIQNRQFDRAFTYNKKNDKANRALQTRFARNSTRWQFKQLMDAADQSGIHRLAALGGASGSQYSPAGGVGTPSTDIGGPGASLGSGTPIFQEEAAFLGDAISDGINAYQRGQRDKLQDKYNQKQLELMDAQIEEIRATTRTQLEAAKREARDITTTQQEAAQETSDVQKTAPASTEFTYENKTYEVRNDEYVKWVDNVPLIYPKVEDDLESRILGWVDRKIAEYTKMRQGINKDKLMAELRKQVDKDDRLALERKMYDFFKRNQHLTRNAR